MSQSATVAQPRWLGHADVAIPAPQHQPHMLSRPEPWLAMLSPVLPTYESALHMRRLVKTVAHTTKQSHTRYASVMARLKQAQAAQVADDGRLLARVLGRKGPIAGGALRGGPLARQLCLAVREVGQQGLARVAQLRPARPQSGAASAPPGAGRSAARGGLRRAVHALPAQPCATGKPVRRGVCPSASQVPGRSVGCGASAADAEPGPAAAWSGRDGSRTPGDADRHTSGGVTARVKCAWSSISQAHWRRSTDDLEAT